ncbi:MAG: hypothetical protein ACLGIS_06270, partial [Actinomycetes bacterium]
FSAGAFKRYLFFLQDTFTEKVATNFLYGVFLFLTPERSCRGRGARCRSGLPDGSGRAEKEVGK